MELKRIKVINFVKREILLIVPYGIETCIRFAGTCLGLLLIVPYGIETSKESFLQSSCKAFNRTLWN